MKHIISNMIDINAIYEAEITGYTSDGRGVAHIEGCAVFVPNAIAGERCTLCVTHIGKNSAVGKIEQILVKSPHRVPKACPYAKLCGGCVFWHMDYEEECRLKAQRVRDALTRIGGFDPGPVPICGAPEIQGYRNKAQFPVSKVKGRAEAGFYRAGTHSVVPVDRCLIQSEQANLAKSAVVTYMRRYHVAPYRETDGSGLIRHIYARCGRRSGQVLVCIVTNADRLPHQKELVRLLRENVPGLCGVVLCVNRARNNTILGDTFVTLWGEDATEDILCGMRFRISPRSFYQVNHDQAERLYEKAVALAALTPEQTVLDLYCGTGTITLIMAKHAGRAVGVEIVEDAVRNARENAQRNGVDNVQFVCADAAQAARQIAQTEDYPDVVVVDPPRKGLDAVAIDAIEQMRPQRVVYVSCDPATLARDIKRFTAYTPTEVQAFDLFPRTAHVETVVKLERETL